MIIPIPILIPLFRHRESVYESQAKRERDERVAKIDAFKYQQDWEQHQWDNMDYSKTYFIIWNDTVRECYCKKGRLQPKDVCCFVNEGKLSYISTRLLHKTKAEAEECLRKMKEPRDELVIEPWRGTYRLFNKTTGKVVKVYKD